MTDHPSPPPSAPSAAAAGQRRALRFDTFDEVIADVRRLELGYRRAGNWTLGQACDHLARFMRFSLDGFPPGFRLPAPLAWLMRRVMLSPKSLQKPMPGGMRAPKFLLPPPPEAGVDARAVDRAAADRLVEQCRRVKVHGGEFFPSPLFGRLRPAVWRQVHLNHCAHHLGFLVPDDPFAASRGDDRDA